MLKSLLLAVFMVFVSTLLITNAAVAAPLLSDNWIAQASSSSAPSEDVQVPAKKTQDTEGDRQDKSSETNTSTSDQSQQKNAASASQSKKSYDMRAIERFDDDLYGD